MKFITRLADIWSCRHAQYQLGRPCHIYRRANMARANMDFHIWASLISKLLDFHSGYDCRLRFLNQLRSCPQVDHIKKLVCCRLPRWCDRYHHQIIRTYVTSGCNKMVYCYQNNPTHMLIISTAGQI